MRKIGETLWYVALWQDQWIALLSFSAPASKCAPRDRWTGWSSRLQYDRLKLITNNSRFLILPSWHLPNLASRILALCQHRLNTDWQNTFGHPLLDWDYDEDRGRIRSGYGPENVTRLRRFAIRLIKSKGVRSVPQKMRQLNRNIRLVFDYLRITRNPSVPLRL